MAENGHGFLTVKSSRNTQVPRCCAGCQSIQQRPSPIRQLSDIRHALAANIDFLNPASTIGGSRQFEAA
jgi:hypothetical protein